MKRRFHNIVDRHYVAVYSVLFVISVGIVFWFIPVHRTSLIHASDGFNQCYPTYAYIGRYLRELIPNLLRYHTIPMFDWSIGYGDDVISTLNWFGLGNAFYLLAALAPAKLASIMFTFQSILQMYLAGLAFSWSAKYWNEDAWSRLVGAFLYTFSAYALSFGINFPSFLLVYVTFPVLMDGVTRILRSEQLVLSKRYIGALFILSCSGFYYVYMDLIAVMVYGILCGVFYYRHRIREYLRVVLSLAAQTCISIGMSCVILLPVVIAYLRSARSGEQSDTNAIFTLFSAGEMPERLRGILDINSNGTAIGFTLPVVVLIVVFLIKYRRKYPVLATGVILCVAGYCVPAAGSIMNGFSYSIDRWVYILHYLVAVIAVLVIPDLTDILRQEIRLRRWANVLAVCVYLVWAVATWIHGADDLPSTAIHIALIGITLLLLLLLERRSKAVISAYCILCTILMSFLYYAPTQAGGDGIYRAFKNYYTWHEIEASAFANADAEETFYRTDIYDSSLNSALVTGTNSASSYYSICNSGPFAFLNARVVSTGTEGSCFTLRGLDGRKALEMFLSVHSYALDRSADEIVTNDLKLPLGFTYTSYMLEGDAKTQDPLDRNQNLLRLVELEAAPDSDTLTRVTDSDQDWESMPCEPAYDNIEDRGDHTFRASETSEIRVALPDGVAAEEDREYYLVFHGLEWMEDGFERYLDVNGKRMRLVPMGSYAGQGTEYMVKVDLTEETLARGYLCVGFEKEGLYHLDSMELRTLDLSQYEQYYGQLTEAVLDNATYQPNQIRGTMTTDQDRILVMTIPYSSGWSCRIDGVETPIYRADQGFSAVVVSPGTHEVTWSYCTPGLVPGLCMSLLSVAVLVLLMQYQRRRGSVL